MNDYIFYPRVPDEINKYIFSFCENERLNLISTSKPIQGIVEKTAKEKKDLFIMNVGALAEHELEMPIDKIGTLHDRVIRLESRSRSSILAFDEDGYPYLKDKEDLSWSETILKKYYSYHREPVSILRDEQNRFDPAISAKVREIFANDNQIALEFSENTPDLIDATKDCEAFSDYADRFRRYYALIDERRAYARISQRQGWFFDYNILEKVVYSIVSFVHNVINFIFNWGDDRYLFSANSLDETSLHSRTVLLGKRMVHCEEGNVEVELTARSGHFEVNRSDNNAKVGALFFSTSRAGLDVEINIEQDAIHNAPRHDKPIIKLLTQLAVEVFERHPAKVLNFTPIKGHILEHCAVSGCGVSESFVAPLKAIQEHNRQKRIEGSLYSDQSLYDDRGYVLRIYKSSELISTEGLTKKDATKFFNVTYNYENETDLYLFLGNREPTSPVKKVVGPAILEDAVVVNNQVIVINKTWEEYIRDNGPILSPGSRSVLR